MTQQKKKWSTKKKIFAAIGAVVVILAAIYIYFATQTFDGTKSIKEDYTVNALDFIKEFRANDSAANQKYREKIIIVTGIVSEVEAPDTSTFNIKFIDTATQDYAIFAFQEQYLRESKSVKAGDKVSIKGSCSGSSFTEILDAYSIPFKRSTLIKN